MEKVSNFFFNFFSILLITRVQYNESCFLGSISVDIYYIFSRVHVRDLEGTILDRTITPAGVKNDRQKITSGFPRNKCDMMYLINTKIILLEFNLLFIMGDYACHDTEFVDTFSQYMQIDLINKALIFET